MEGRKRNEKPHETAERHGHRNEAVPETHFKSLALLSYSSLACKPEVCTATVCKKLLAASLELAQTLNAVLSALQEDWRLLGEPLQSPEEHQYHLYQRRHRSAANKVSQTAELPGKLGAVI